MPKKSNNYSLIKKCRLCDSKRIRKIFDFGSLPIGNDLKDTKKQSINCQKYPLKIINCLNCNHFQLSISVDPKILFAKNYTYLTGVTKTFKNHFNEYSKWVIKKCNIKKNSLIIDIGSNDGTCLGYFKKNKMRVLGIDPAKQPCLIANKNGIDTVNNFFNKKTGNYILKKYGSADFITSHNVLAHTKNIKEIFIMIFKLLKNNGYFCFEIGYFKDVVKKNLFDTIYHEHLDYYHAKPLAKFLEKIGFSVINISTNDIQGGTLRFLLQKKQKIKKRPKAVSNFIKRESNFFKKSKIYNKFNMFHQSMNLLNKKVKSLKMNQNSIFGYGSPTKASLLLINSKLNELSIKNTFEDNLLKCNKYIPGTDIKIISSMKIRKKNPQTIIILAWNFTKEIILKLKKKNIKNINLITPLPTPRITKL